MNRLKELRQKRGLTIRALAEKLSISHTQITHIENGKRNLTTKNALEIADFFGVSVDYLMGISAEQMFNDFADSVNREFTEDVVNSDGSVVQKYRDASPAVCRKLEIVKALRDLNDIEALDEILQLVKLKQAQGDFKHE